MSNRKELGLTSKDKRMIRKARQKLVQVAWEVVQKANNVPDPLEKFKAFKKFTKGDFTAELSCHPVTELDKQTKEAIFDLERDNMKQLYEDCDWGWHEKKKREEMFDDRARYLIAKAPDGKLVAFSHYRFDLDFDIEVLYCYELQLVPETRRKGLGKFMLQILELIAFSNNMKKVVLTVLKNNLEAMQFFKVMNYEADETSPMDDAFETYDYIILCKKNKKLASQNSE
ncbi:N-alpha-acetyltransferase 40 [Planococcus citri]|uniref:N-alpha-acetyltransferase 40 n=1 Tax=Planococcus citri TaxID=170843 RepID=UPI0031F75DA5